MKYLFAQHGMYGANGYGTNHGMYGNGCGASHGTGLFGLIFLLLVVAGIVLLIRYLSHEGVRKNDQAIEILNKRYALGEINKEEFETKKKDLLKEY